VSAAAEQLTPRLTRRLGTRSQPGVMFLTLQELFRELEKKRDELVTEVQMTYVEVSAHTHTHPRKRAQLNTHTHTHTHTHKRA
jgi:hypothetical protein